MRAAASSCIARSASSAWCAGRKAAAFNLLLIVDGRRVRASGRSSPAAALAGWSAGANVISYNWALQTSSSCSAARASGSGRAGNPERAELTAWNTHQVWRLYRANWQGMVGLGILVVFLLMALLAPFLADHALLDPNAQIKDPPRASLRPVPPADHVLLQLVRHRPGRAVGARRSSSGARASRSWSACWPPSCPPCSAPASASPPASTAAGRARRGCASPTPSWSSPGCRWPWSWPPPGARTTG